MKIIKEENAKEKDDEFWDTARPDTLTQSEKDVYVMIDSVQNIKAFRLIILALYCQFTTQTQSPYNLNL